MSIDKLSLEGLDFQATKINIKNNILFILFFFPKLMFWGYLHTYLLIFPKEFYFARFFYY